MGTYETRPDRFGLTEDQRRNVGGALHRRRLGGLRQSAQERVDAIGQYMRALQAKRKKRGKR